MAAVLSDKSILKELRKKIFIEPFNGEQLNPSSYNLTISEDYFECSEDTRAETQGPIFCDKVESVSPLYKKGSVIEKDGVKYILLQAFSSVIFATKEIAGCVAGVSCEIKPRSTLNRLGISMNVGWGDPGFVSHWGVTLTNRNHRHYYLPVGSSVCQLVFYRTEEGTSYTGNYQVSGGSEDPVENARRTWKPEDILPKTLKVLSEGTMCPGGICPGGIYDKSL